MKKQKAISSRDLGLEFAAICGKHFLGIEHLHYGLWTDDLEVSLNNLRIAQQRYTDFLISHIPEGVRTILDVGCGSGHTSKRLSEMGYRVACVSPSPVLSQHVRELLGENSSVFECKYEDLHIEDKFDLVLFSESFQYINIERGFEKTFEILNPAGYMLICDVFRKDMNDETEKKSVGGGKRLAKFNAIIAMYPFELIQDEDITSQTAPNLDILDDILKNAVKPMVDSATNFLSGRYPLMSKFLLWKYRRRIDKVYQKYFNGQRTSEDFLANKSYRLLLYKNACTVGKETQKITAAPAAGRDNSRTPSPAGM